MNRLFLLSLFLCLAACSTVNLPEGQAAYDLVPAANANAEPAEYRIGALDVLKITVFQEPDLSLESVPVDAAGNILFPLIGKVSAARKTTSELSDDIAARLATNFLVDPQVSTIVTEAVSQKVTVEGSVNKPGVFEIDGSTNLIQALALAEGPTRTARLGEVVVFRTIDNQVYGAKFDYGKIRRGEMPNPELLGGDTVVVGFSFAKGAFRDFLTVAPLLTSAFIQLTR